MFLGFLIGAKAQSITVIDNQSLQPIEKVEVYNASSNVVIGRTDANGTINLDQVQKNIDLTFIHPNYSKITFTKEEIEKMDGIVRMSENINSLEEVVVSASKFEEKRKDVAQKIQVIRASEIQNMNQSSTADLMSNSGNIMVQKSQLGGGSPIIRGFETNKVLIVVDGVRMNNAIYRGGHLQNIITLDNSILDRTEIVFGPGSVVYGSDALGGVMSFYTKNPSLSSNDKVLVKSGAYARYMSAAEGYATHADVSVGGKKFGSLTSFTYSKFGDLWQGANREPFVGSFGARPWYQERINGKDSMVVNKDTNLQVGSGYSQIDLLQKFMFKQNDYVNHILNFQYSTSSNIDRYDRLVQMSGGKPKFAEWYYGPQERLFGSYTLQLSKANKIYDNARFILGYQQVGESRNNRRFEKDVLDRQFEQVDVYSLNLDMAKKSGEHELRYGIDGWYNIVDTKAHSENIVTGEEKPIATRYASGGATMSSFAVYATHTWEITEKLILNDGLRFTNVGLNAKFTDTTFFKFPFKDAKQNNSALTGNIGLIYMPNNDFRLTWLASTGFRAPNVDDLSKVFETSSSTLIVPNNDLKPEYTYNTELGVSNTFNDWLTLQATAYYTLYENALTVQPFKYNGLDSLDNDGDGVKSQVVAMTNANKAYMYGLELSMNGKLNKNVSVYATYNYTHARIVTDSIAIPLDHIPPVFGKLGLQLTENKFRADFFVNYSAWKRIEDYNPFGEDNQTYALPEGMPSWYTVNARLTYQFHKSIGLQVACENILDQNYRVFASNISAPGRNFIITLRGNF